MSALPAGLALGARMGWSLRGGGRRTMLEDRGGVELALARMLDDGAAATAIVVLPRGFHDMIAALGRGPADELLRALGARLTAIAGDAGVVANIGPACFAVALPGTEADAGGPIAALLAAVEEPLKVEGIGYPVRAVVGIASSPDAGCDAAQLLDRAEVALHAGSGLRRRFDPVIEETARRRVAVLADLEEALTSGQLHLHFQPIIDIATGAVGTVEALVRWDHPVHGEMPPASFIPLAEQTELIGPLTEHVLGLALDHCAAWRRDGLELRVAVNLSSPNVTDPQLADRVAEMLLARGLTGDVLKLEITESVLMQQPREAAAALGALRAQGVTISLDDFGTGYSSLAYLKDLPLDEVKIDRSFVGALQRDDRSAAVLRTIVALAAELDLGTVAEGVEDHATLAAVAGMGCTMAQGYHVARPLAPRALRTWIDRRFAVPEAVPARAQAGS